MQRRDQIFLRTLGPISASFDEAFASSIKFTTRKTSALLVYLAMSPRQVATREHLATLLWGSGTDEQARQSLRQALAYLRKDTQPLRFLTTSAGAVGLLPGSVQTDLATLERLAASSDIQDLERAAELANGEFLAGFNSGEEAFDDWLRHQRRRAEVIATGALEKYARFADRDGKGLQAIATVGRLLEIDPVREDWQRLALTVYAKHRGRNEALVQAAVFEKRLHDELQAEPEPQTQELIAQIEKHDFEVAPRSQSAFVLQASEVASPVANADVRDMSPPNGSTALKRGNMLEGFRRQLTGAVALLIGALLLLSGGARRSTESLEDRGRLVGSGSELSRYWTPPPLAVKIAPASKAEAIPLVVLPLRTYEDGDAARGVAEILGDDLINMLSRVHTLRVISGQTSRTFAARPINIPEIQASLRVRFILDGRVRKHGDKVVVHVDLIDADSKFVVWSTGVENNGSDQHDVVENIVRRLARELTLETNLIESQRVATEASTELLVRKGTAAIVASGRAGLDALRQAKTYFEEALEREPGNISALAGLGGVYANIAAQRYAQDHSATFAKAEDYLVRALKAQPAHMQANFYLGVTKAGSGQLEEGLEHFLQVIAINPSHAVAHGQIGHTLARLGRPAEGLEHVRYALRLSPKDPIRPIMLEFACNAEIELGRAEQAIDDCNRSVALNPSYLRGWAGLAAAYALSGNRHAARQALDRLKSLDPTLTDDAIVKRFGRHKANGNKLTEGLRTALLN